MRELHPWNLSEKEMIWIQEWLRGRVQMRGPYDRVDPGVVGVLSVGFEDTFHLYTELVLVRYPPITPIGNSMVDLKSLDAYPAKDTLQAFRVVPNLLGLLSCVVGEVDIVVVYGYHGICHQRRLGIAAHLGVLLEVPTIGVAGTLPPEAHVEGKYIIMNEERIEWSEEAATTAIDLGLAPSSKVYPRVVGMVVEGLCVSPGHMIGVDRAGEIAQLMLSEGAIPCG